MKISQNFVAFSEYMNFIIQKLKSKHTSLKKYTNCAKLTEQNYFFFSRFEGTRGENPQIFRTLAIGTIVLVVNFYKCYKSNVNPMSDVMSERARVQTNQTNHEINNADTTDGGKGTKGQ